MYPLIHFLVDINQKGKNMHKTDLMIKDEYGMYFTLLETSGSQPSGAQSAHGKAVFI
jgi:hypothetical protein